MDRGLDLRRRQPEWMDDPQADPVVVRQSLRFIRRINWLLGYTRSTLHHLRRFSRRWRPGERIEIVDLATGSADIPRAILRWADRRGFDLRIVGVELHPVAAQARGGDARLQIVQADALAAPFADGAFDYAMTNMFLHHLDGPQVVALLATMDRLSRRGVIAADLLRHRRALAWIKLLTVLANPMVRHDAPISVAQAFTQTEILALRDRAGLSYARCYRHFGHRFVLAGEKN